MPKSFLIVLFVMDTVSALFRLPFFAFALQECVYTLVADRFEVFNLTHAVFCLIPAVQTFQSLAGKLLALKTILAISMFAQLDPALDGPAVHLPAGIATRAFIFFS